MNRPKDAVARLARLAAALFVLCFGAFSARAQTPQITSPGGGSVSNPGQTLTIAVAATPGAFQTVVVVGDLPLGSSQVVTAPPYQFQIQIPPDITPGPYTLMAVGVTSDGNAVDSDAVTVAIERPDAPQSLSSDLLTLTFDYIEGSAALIVYGAFSDGSKVDLTRSTLTAYTSDNPAVATVDANGVVTAVGSGAANITVANSGASVQIPVTVPAALTIVPRSRSLYVSQTAQFAARVAISPDLSDQSVTWSLNPPLGSIDNTGVYTAPVSVDSVQGVTVTATSVADNTKSASVPVWLFPPISVTVTPTAVTLGPNQGQSFTARVAYTAWKDVVWSITPPGMGTIDSDGHYASPLTIPPGQTATVTATSVADNTKSASAHIALLPSVVVSVTPATATLRRSQTQRFAATVTYATDTTVTWSISPNVGTIDASGLYTAPATITSQQTVTVTALSRADNWTTGAATITLLPYVSGSITTPQALTASAVSLSQIDLTWTASTEPGGAIAGYNIFRNGALVDTSTTTSYSDRGLLHSTSYVYTVTAYDALGDNSAPSASAGATTLSGPLAPGLVAYYSFDEGSGTFLHDHSGTGNNGFINAAVWSSSGRSGSALSFPGMTDDGGTSWVAVPDSSSLDLTTGMTLEAWVNPATLNGFENVGGLIGVLVKEKEFPDLCYGLFASSSGGNVPAADVFIDWDQTVYGPWQLALNAWTHLAATYDGATLNLYVNGVLVASSPQTGAIATAPGSLYIGSGEYWGQYFTGMIDEVRIYNRALSQDEIQADMLPPGIVSISLGPASATLNPSQTLQFTAPVIGSSNTGVNWSVALGQDAPTGAQPGTVSASGLYSAPDSIASVYAVIVTAQSQADPTKSASATVTLKPPEAISTPAAPTGQASGNTGTSYWYTTSQATSSYGHELRYKFDWGDGTDSSWLGPGAIAAPHTWTVAGTYQVTVQARCATDTSVVSAASSPLTVVISAPETVSTPTASGPPSGTTGMSYSYTASGATSSYGHSVQYKFDWGDGTDSGWVATSASHTWTSAGTYSVTVQARCTADPTVVSATSSPLPVVISGVETISTPTLSGPTSGLRATSYTYTASGATSSYGHPVQYQFSWGDGTNSGWLATGTTSASHTWTTITPLTYPVKVQARCATDPSVLSADSSALSVAIGAPDLAITKTHTGGFTRGQSGAYTITVTNAGGWPTSGTVTVTDTLPTGLTATAIDGTGWSCTLGTRTCTRTDVLASGASHPPITLTVNVAADAPAAFANSATVSGGGEPNHPYYTRNNTVTDGLTVEGAPPVASPTNLIATVISGFRVDVAWSYTQDPGNPATVIRLERQTGAGVFALIATMYPGTTSFSDNTVNAETTYTYRAYAANVGGSSALSNTATVTIPPDPPTPLPAPTNLSAPEQAITTYTVTLVWTPVTGARTYTIQRSTDGGTTWTTVGTTVGMTYRVTGLTTHTTYMFRVIATNGNPAATSPPSAPVTVTTN